LCGRLKLDGPKYLLASLHAEKNYFDGGKTYKFTLSAKIPERNFWSVILFENQMPSMLQTGQPFPKVGSLSYSRPAAVANADGSTTIYIGPTLTQGVKLCEALI
jgi:hypothetical protein